MVASSRVVADVGLVRLITKFGNSGRQLGTDHHRSGLDETGGEYSLFSWMTCKGVVGFMA
jgi:hypothetical protein